MHNVILADDHQIVKDGLKLILKSTSQFNIIGDVANGDDLLEAACLNKPDLIISDLKMPGVSIIDSCIKIKSVTPDTKIIVLTAFDDSEDIYLALDRGIDGYIMKDTLPEQIINTINMVLMGYSCFQPKVDRIRPAKEEKKEIESVLSFTEREKEIFQLIVENLSNQEIANALFISEATVKTHVSSILRKTGQSNRSQAVLYALKEGLVTI
jgi:DNA-binding NarL/FixJ family response regulator